MLEDLFQIPVFLYGIFYMLCASAIPILASMWIIRRFIKSGKKTGRAIRY